MGIDKTASDRKGRSSEAKKQRNRQRRLHPVQNLYDTCKEVFADCRPDVVPSPENVERVKAILDKMSGTDVGLWPSQTFFKATGNDKPPRITYMGIHECDKFSIGIFCLPPSGVMPLHNHPGMTVFSKILFGKMHIQSYDWVDGDPNVDKSYNYLVSLEKDPNDGILFLTLDWRADWGLANVGMHAGNPSGVRLAKMKVNSDFSAPCKSSILYPKDCNMHCFRALTACAVLDVLVPPYNDLEGRHCQYYSEFPFSNGPGEEGVAQSAPEVPEEGPEKGYVWLKERAMPEDLAFVGALYKGPKLAK